MANTIQEQLDATGYAKVLVVVRPPVLAPAGVGLGLGPATGSDLVAAGHRIADEMARYFVVAPHGQQAELAAEALRRPVRGARRGRGAGAAAAALDTGAAPPPEVPKVRVYPHLGVMLGTVDRAGLDSLQRDGRVEAVHSAPPLSLIRPVAAKAPKKKPTGATWGVDLLGIPELWAKGYTGKGVLIGHLDTGVDGKHPALKGAVAHFAEFDLQGRQVPKAKAHDSGEHGTHTAGTIAARRVGSTSFGVAPGARLVSAMVIEGGDVIARILAGMDWALSRGVRLLSMSLGLRGYTPDFLVLTQVLRARNVLPVFAVGNEGAGTSRSPGNYAESLSVGACDPNRAVCDFSSGMRFDRAVDPIVPDLVAPGQDVLSCIPGGRYAEMSGTSMATPHIAGLAAVLMQASPAATANDIEKAIFDSCSLPPGMLPDRGNRGIPSGPRALALLTGLPASGVVPGPGGRRARRPARPTRRRRSASKSAVRPAARRAARKAARR